MKMDDYLRLAVESKASDTFIIADAPASMKVNGEMRPIVEGDQPLKGEDSYRLIQEVYMGARRSPETLQETGDDDFSYEIPEVARFRVNTYRQRGTYAMVIRTVAVKIPDYKALGIPEELMDLSQLSHGMILVTGTAGSGKSTTEACLIDRINSTRACHIVTMEDPIEFLYFNKKSIISQREVSIDTEDFLSALRAVLRQAPDVIQVGEMRDQETIRAAITAAETGHLLMATLHTSGAANSIDRIIDTFPPASQQQIRIQLSSVLHTVISQKLLPDTNGGRVVAFEVMHMTNAVRALIRDSKTHQIDNAISTGAAAGMISMDQSILGLYKKGRITARTAVEFSADPEQMKKKVML